MVTIPRKQPNAVFPAIADPTRRGILGLLRGGRQTFGEIAGHFRTSRSAISKHLRLRRSVGLVVTDQDGTARIRALNAKPPRAINDWLRDYVKRFGTKVCVVSKKYVEEKR